MASKPRSRPHKPSSVKATTTISPTAPAIPPPFYIAPPSLASFTKLLPSTPSNIYILTLDRTSRSQKLTTFLTYLLLHLLLLIPLLYRLSTQLPFYKAIALYLLGLAPPSVPLAPLSRGAMIALAVRRAATFFVDFMLVKFSYPVLRGFFYSEMKQGNERGSPVNWRWRAGVKDVEVVVRRSRAVDEGVQGEGAFELLVGKLERALDKGRVGGQTGYLLMDGEWDLDWRLMVDATRLRDEGLGLGGGKGMAFVSMGDRGGWMIFEPGDGGPESTDDGDGLGKVTRLFREELMGMGKEDLFFKWVRLLDYEGRNESARGEDGQQRFEEMARALFSEGGVDYEQLMGRIRAGAGE